MSQKKIVPLAVDVFENDAELLVVADLPGVTQDKVDARIEQQRLSVSATRADGVTFERTFRVPAEVDAERVTATLKDGVVSVKLPKVGPKTRQIPVSAT
jgi:HSP20 family protein